jgi:Flp pilus assembly protein TadD
MQNSTSIPVLAPNCTTLADRRRAADALYATGHLLLEQQKPAHASGVFRAMALLAPTDERAWLGLGACHEAIDQIMIALEMYGTGRMLARAAVRCELARARLLTKLGRDEDADDARTRAEELAEAENDETLRTLVANERRTP